MIIDVISDLHGHFPELKGGDILIVAGDHTRSDKLSQWIEFYDWLMMQKYRKKILIAGNHDNAMEFEADICKKSLHYEYLQDSGTEFEGLTIWGSPWTQSFENMNPHCKAFCLDSEHQLEEKFNLIPKDTDILVTHSPPYDILDSVYSWEEGRVLPVGSSCLLKKTLEIKPKLHIFGHIHECGGRSLQLSSSPTIFVNASRVNERYIPINEARRFEL